MIPRVGPLEVEREADQRVEREAERRAVDEEQHVEVHRERVQHERIDQVDQRATEDEQGGARVAAHLERADREERRDDRQIDPVLAGALCCPARGLVCIDRGNPDPGARRDRHEHGEQQGPLGDPFAQLARHRSNNRAARI